MKVEMFAKKVGVCLNPNMYLFTMMVQFGEHNDEMPYPVLVEMPFDTAERLMKELGLWVPLLRAKIDNRSLGEGNAV